MSALATDMPVRTSLPFPLFSAKHFPSTLKPYLHIHLSSHRSHPKIARTNTSGSSGRRAFSESSAHWLSKWSPPLDSAGVVKARENREWGPAGTDYIDKDKGSSAIERIVLRLRNLGLADEGEVGEGGDSQGSRAVAVRGDEKLGDLLQRDWVRPDKIPVKDGEEDMVLPWERADMGAAVPGAGLKKNRTVKAPTLADLTIEDEELRRLRRLGMSMKERITVPKAGTTQAILEMIHDKWRKHELVKLKFHEFIAHDMKKAHQIVEHRSGGLVIWRAGSVMVVYRGSDYRGPPSIAQPAGEGHRPFIPDVSSSNNLRTGKVIDESSTPEKRNAAAKTGPVSELTKEEAEYSSLLDGLGPRFVDWWDTGVLPVDADLLPPDIPGYKTPFRLLPTGMRSRLTSKELTSLRNFSKGLPCHFALGRNRHHQGLAAAIVKLWEKSLVVKIAVKPGVQNTNNKLMSDELKNLTGGVLLMRNKYYIVMYRGKDFLPPTVSAALAERQILTKEIQNVEEEVRNGAKTMLPSVHDQVQMQAGTLAEFYEAQARWGRETSLEEQEKMIEEASRAKSAKIFERMKHKLAVAQARKFRAESLLAKIEASMVPIAPSDDQETLTNEEKFMFRRVGLRMKAYLPLGIRGVFDGVIENMHLHWKHRELVKLITKQKTSVFVEETARLLEYESGGILVAIERAPKGYVLIYYRGKNYRRPVTLRPRNLLTKAKALKRSIAMQRHEGLSQHISTLETTIEQMKVELGIVEDAEDEKMRDSKAPVQSDHDAESGDEAVDYHEGLDSDGDEGLDSESGSAFGLCK